MRASTIGEEAQRRLEFEQLYVDPGSGQFLSEVLKGLSRRPLSLPYYYLYDARGSELFEQITALPEYYLTGCEREILAANAAEILNQAGAPKEIVEFGSGSAEKTRILLRAALKSHPQVCFVPIDISEKTLKDAAQSLITEMSGLRVHALAAEYRQGLEALSKDGPPRLFLFMGSSIGNMSDEEAIQFLSRIPAICRPFDRVLIGADLAKDPSVVEPAYNDAKSVTAQFNLNLLTRINRELGGNFNLRRWSHVAPYLVEEGHVEMRLVSLRDQEVHIGENRLSFSKDAYIWTERSRKYSEARLGQIVRQSGFETIERWYDSKNWFTVRLLQPLLPRSEGSLL